MDLLFPVYCFLCSRWISTTHYEAPICSLNRHALPELSNPHCYLCSKPMNETPTKEPEDSVVCGRCRTEERVLHRTVAGFTYEEPMDSIIEHWKFDGNPQWGTWLGEQLKQATESYLEEGWDVVAPLPMHPRRFNERGFNQTVQLAEIVSQYLDSTLVSLLRKDRHTPPQSSLSREERMNNLDGAFSLDTSETKVTNQSILLVDDIYTTGSTLQMAGEVIKKQNPSKIGAVVLARAV
ncbi:MAG: ComF family protein [bacterium]